MSTMESTLTHSGPMNPVSAQPASFEAWQALVAPGDVFRHPRDVLIHPTLTRAEKRAILASWASDACALENSPGLRCLVGSRAEPVPVDAVLAALAELDEEPGPSAGRRTSLSVPPRRRPIRLLTVRRTIRPGRKDDDDPPPSPAPAMPRPRPRIPQGGAALAV